jgi:hypothetical protein
MTKVRNPITQKYSAMVKVTVRNLDIPNSARGTTVIALAVRKTTSAALIQAKQMFRNRLRPGNSLALRFAWVVLTVPLMPNGEVSGPGAASCQVDGKCYQS